MSAECYVYSDALRLVVLRPLLLPSLSCSILLIPKMLSLLYHMLAICTTYMAFVMLSNKDWKSQLIFTVEISYTRKCI